MLLPHRLPLAGEYMVLEEESNSEGWSVILVVWSRAKSGNPTLQVFELATLLETSQLRLWIGEVRRCIANRR